LDSLEKSLWDGQYESPLRRPESKKQSNQRQTLDEATLPSPLERLYRIDAPEIPAWKAHRALYSFHLSFTGSAVIAQGLHISSFALTSGFGGGARQADHRRHFTDNAATQPSADVCWWQILLQKSVEVGGEW
jgi:hypothetical protein